MIQFSKFVTFTSLFSSDKSRVCGKAQLTKCVTMSLILAILAAMPVPVSAFECSNYLKSCEEGNARVICNAFKEANRLSIMKCSEVWEKYKDCGNSTCKHGIKETYYRCILSK